MRHRSILPTILAACLATATIFGLQSTTAAAAPSAPAVATVNPSIAPPQASAVTAVEAERDTTRTAPVPENLRGEPQRLPQPATAPTTASPRDEQSCTPADFSGRTGPELAAYIEASTTSCINSLFRVGTGDMLGVFNESQMIAVAQGYADVAASYPGDDSTGLEQLNLYLRAGYYNQFYHPTVIPPYTAALKDATSAGLDAFFASPHLLDVTDINGEVLGEAVTLTDSADLQGRYLGVYQQILAAYDASWDPLWHMVNAANSVYTPLWRGNQNPDYVAAIVADPSIITALHDFAIAHLGLLGGDKDYLASNAGRDASILLEHPELQETVRPIAKDLLDNSQVGGPTASMWVPIAYNAERYDHDQCAFYPVCDYKDQVKAVSLPINHPCDSTRTILAQKLTDADLAAVCASLQNQDAFFHNVVKDNGEIPGQHEQTIKMVIYGSPLDYATYSWVIWGNSTNNGGETIIGNPTDPNNDPFCVLYQHDRDNGFVARAWNLNHEYTHYLDARYDMKGDFPTQISVPDVWWIEGLAEYVSYSYRNLDDTQAIDEAANHTYALSTLWQSTYDNSDVVRTYPWGYLAVRFMMEHHADDVYAMLAKFRTGDYQGAYAVYNSTIGTRYDNEFNAWLDKISGNDGTVKPCTDTDARQLARNCFRTGRSASQGNTDGMFIMLPARTVTLTVTTTSGTGTAYLYYNPDTWADQNHFTQSSTNSGTEQKITVSNDTRGWRYISLYGQTAFSGVTITTQY